MLTMPQALEARDTVPARAGSETESGHIEVATPQPIDLIADHEDHVHPQL